MGDHWWRKTWKPGRSNTYRDKLRNFCANGGRGSVFNEMSLLMEELDLRLERLEKDGQKITIDLIAEESCRFSNTRVVNFLKKLERGDMVMILYMSKSGKLLTIVSRFKRYEKYRRLPPDAKIFVEPTDSLRAHEGHQRPTLFAQSVVAIAKVRGLEKNACYEDGLVRVRKDALDYKEGSEARGGEIFMEKAHRHAVEVSS